MGVDKSVGEVYHAERVFFSYSRVFVCVLMYIFVRDTLRSAAFFSYWKIFVCNAVCAANFFVRFTV